MPDSVQAVMPHAETIRASLTALADAPGLLAGDAVADLVPRLWPYSFTYLWSALRIDGRDATFAERFERVRGVAYSTSPWRPEGGTTTAKRCSSGSRRSMPATSRPRQSVWLMTRSSCVAHREVAELEGVTRDAMGDPRGPLAERTGAAIGHPEGHVVHAVLLLAIPAALGGYLGLLAAGAASATARPSSRSCFS